MRSYEKSDGWKLCHELTLATFSAVDEPLKRNYDPVLDRLVYAALRAVGRIAFGSGNGNRKLMCIALFQALGWLSEYREVLEVAEDRRLLERKVIEELESLRGRATFYTSRMLPAPPPQA